MKKRAIFLSIILTILLCACGARNNVSSDVESVGGSTEESTHPVNTTPSTPADGGGTSSVGSQSAQPTYTVVADPASYEVSAASITVKITNTSLAEGEYGYAHRIERNVGGNWEPLDLDIMWNDIAVILPAGQTNTETFNLYQEQYDYRPGNYRIVFLDGLSGLSAQFTLDY